MGIKGKKIAFIVGAFPIIPGTWTINQVADLIDRGVDLDIYSFHPGDKSDISDKFYKYEMATHTHYLDMPKNKFWRILVAIPKALHMLIRSPASLARVFNFKRYGWQAVSLETLFWSAPFLGKHFDLIHCHFGKDAVKFMEIRYILGLKQKIITSFYGQDVSQVFRVKSRDYYDEVKRASSAFIVMSEFMKKRIMAHGFDESKIHVLPIFGIDVNDYPFKERSLKDGETFNMISVGRFVEKKGFDDLLRAIAIVKERTGNKFMCTIIGGGPLEPKIHAMAKELNVEDVVSFTGYMKTEKMIDQLLVAQLYLQPSKTASDGDME